MDDLPFRGQTFLVATSEDLADKVARAVRERGGRAIPFPTIRLVPPADYENLDRGLRLWRTLDWVVFTSAHGVEAGGGRARHRRSPEDGPDRCRAVHERVRGDSSNGPASERRTGPVDQGGRGRVHWTGHRGGRTFSRVPSLRGRAEPHGRRARRKRRGGSCPWLSSRVPAIGPDGCGGPPPSVRSSERRPSTPIVSCNHSSFGRIPAWSRRFPPSRASFD